MSTIEQSVELDPAAVEAFADRMIGIVNGAATALMTSVGHQTGLFDTLAGRPSSTSVEIAAAAGLDERYVREWLGAMVTSQVAEIDPGTGRYSLPPEHAALLTRKANADNMAVFAQYIAVMFPEISQAPFR